MSCAAEPVQQRHLRLVEAIEDRFDVAGWRSGDVDLWPPARMDLFLDMFRAVAGDTAPPPPPPLQRIAGDVATPLTNLWKSRRDLAHWVPFPRPADAILLGDGVSLDRIDGAWRDRHGEPVMEAMERLGRTTFLMQPGDLSRLPWRRPTYAANAIAVRGAVAAKLDRRPGPDLPDHEAVLELLHREGVTAPSLARARLSRRGRTIAAAGRQFQKLLRQVRPRLAFTVTYYAGLGHAFALACRREGVMCVDLQHCPQEGGHRAYRWRTTPEPSYSTLPAVFWTWSEAEASEINRWADGSPWRQAVHGGHAQLQSFLEDGEPTRRWDEGFAAVGGHVVAQGAQDREILVALQPIGGRRSTWATLARQIEAAPPGWRWWIRRHPSSTPAQDGEYAGLLSLRRANVMVEPASELPLPALLRRMSAVVSLASGAAVEAAAFGVPSFFLDEEARGTFGRLIERRQADIVDAAEILTRLSDLPAVPNCPQPQLAPPLDETLRRLESMAEDYRRLCRVHPLEQRGLS
jgi:hypothetical protein